MTRLEFEYEVIRRPRRKTASISVKPDNAVMVIVPSNLPQERVEKIVRSKARWIRSKLRFNAETRERFKPKEYVSGEAFSYLGRNYRLKVLDGKASPACLRQGRLTISVPHPLTGKDREQHIIRVLTAWYQEQALRRLREKAARYADRLGVNPSSVNIKSYRSRWGSCHKDDRVYFNWRIIMAPHSVVDYVVVHELCHLVHHNHSAVYWKLVEHTCPDYRDAKAWLKINGPLLGV
jgi:predicted metal-dependent hydrolase